MKKQRIITNVVGIVMILSAFLAIILHGWKVKYIDKQEIEGKLTVKNQSVAVGEVVDVTIKLDSNKELNSVEFYLSYDETMLEFQPEDNKEIVGSSGLLHINEQFVKGSKKGEFHVKFKGLQEGNCVLELYDGKIEQYDSLEVASLNKEQVQITVKENQNLSDEATLKELLVYPSSLEQAFESEVTEYSMTVEKDVEQIILTCTPKDSNATVEVHQPEKLKKGLNVIVIKVTAPSGESKQYTISVTKK